MLTPSAFYQPTVHPGVPVDNNHITEMPGLRPASDSVMDWLNAPIAPDAERDAIRFKARYAAATGIPGEAITMKKGTTSRSHIATIKVESIKTAQFAGRVSVRGGLLIDTFSDYQLYDLESPFR